MKGIRLTPFLLFLILLVVLIFGMLFGTSKLIEGNTTMGGQDSGTYWTDADTGTISNYRSGAQLTTVHNDSNTNTIIYFDSYNGPCWVFEYSSKGS